MALYETSFNYEGNNSVISLRNIGLSCLFYKSKEGSFGFCIDDESEEILLGIVKECTWYSINSLTIERLTKDIFEKNKYNMKGLIFLDNQFDNHIEDAKAVVNLKKKNILLSKYKKKLAQIPSNIIIDSFNSISYDEKTISNLLINKNVIIWNWSEFGGHIIFHDFNGCLLKERISKYGFIMADSIEDIPSW